ncbi:hypothetical protein PRIPAC_87459 [Pristionchus pacificus]|uniref:UAS domain-containing protein n=1 Tax=Pristionchus pacificus TaxID=54126 RepID=A0A2A6CW88_PRIPA|nr:hypothetical protein PRIPAC_87459 [Pristionchus pacificus]|eukprot:PDM82455.1 hypothetical protein PRIPAC_36848 [Pristionchus pacificus]
MGLLISLLSQSELKRLKRENAQYMRDLCVMTACLHYSQAAKNKKISLLKSLVRFQTFVKSVATQGGIKQKERSKEVLFPSETVVASKRNGSPLISIDCASVLEGTQKFKEEFGERYCINGRDHLMPPFKIGSLLSVIREDTEGDRRRLALYIHNDKSAFRNIFPREVLCSEGVLGLLRSHFVLWPWDVTEKVNERMLMNELSRCPREISRVVTAVLEQVDRNVDLFPFLIVFKMMNERELKMVDYTTGAFSPTQAREKLISCMDD